MADERYNLSQTGAQVQEDLDAIEDIVVPEKVSDLPNDAGYITEADLPTKLSDLQNDAGFITPSAVPTRVSELSNDSGFVTATQLAAETSRAEGAEGALSDGIDAINVLIPSQASQENKLADQEFVNSSINSNTAHMITDNGEPFSSLAALQQVSAGINDYAYVAVNAGSGTYYDRYKYNGSVWELEYRVNSTVFTASQWAAINSAITEDLVTKLYGLPDALTAISDSEINEICV